VGNTAMDIHGTLVYANKAFANMHGYEVEEVVGRHYSFCHIDQSEMNLVERVCKSGTIVNEEHLHTKKNGSTFPILLNANVIRGEEGAVFFVSSTLIDISERKRMEQELEHKNVRLEETNIALRVVITNSQQERETTEQRMSHMIKTVANPFIAKLKESSLSKEQEAYIRILESNLNGIATSLSTSVHGRFKALTPTEVSVATLISEGKRTKEIAEILHLSVRTVEAHRHNIRRKLRITNEDANLQTVLLSL